MLRWVFTMRTETNEITIPPLQRPRFYCTLQSILRYHCSFSNFTLLSGHSAIVASTMHAFILSHTRSSQQGSPCTTPCFTHQSTSASRARLQTVVGDLCQGRPKVQWPYFRSPNRNAASAAIQLDAVSTALLHQHTRLIQHRCAQQPRHVCAASNSC